MKHLLYFLFALALLFSACISLVTPVREARLTALPTPPHQRPVKIFFPGEALPTTPYVKIKVLSVKRGAAVPTTNLIQELATRAQREGADAILVFGRDVYAETQQSQSTTVDSNGIHTTSSSSTWEWQDVSALAIKYLTGLDYLPDYVREQRLLHWDGQAWQLSATGQVRYGEPTAWQPAADSWQALWAAYDLESILPEPQRQELKTHDGADGLRVTSWFRGPDRTYKYRYRQTEAGRIERTDILITPRGSGRAWLENIQHRYDTVGRLTGRVLETREWGTVLEMRHYDAAGKPLAIDWTRAGQPFLKLELVYYRPEDVSVFFN